ARHPGPLTAGVHRAHGVGDDDRRDDPDFAMDHRRVCGPHLRRSEAASDLPPRSDRRRLRRARATGRRQTTRRLMDPRYGAGYARLYREHWWWRAREEYLARLLDRVIGSA